MAEFICKNKKFNGSNTITMGILNVTPDSFSDGGRYINTEVALKRAEEMISEGVDIIDIGGQSTRPGSERISPEIEWQRIETVVTKLVKKQNAVISVDTFYPYVAERALQCGIHIINDVGGIINLEMAEIIKQYNSGWIITDTSEIKTEDPAAEVLKNLLDMSEKALKFGLKKENLCLDPGFGFGKDNKQNVKLFNGLDKIINQGIFTLAGMSRKRFVGYLSEEDDPENRDAASLALAIIAAKKGVNIIRTHNVKNTVSAIKTINNLKE